MVTLPLLALFCVLWPAYNCDQINDDLLALVAQTGKYEHVTIDASEVDHVKNQILHESIKPKIKRASRAFSIGNQIDYRAMNCNMEKHDGIYYFGMLMTITKNISTPELCASVCWKYNQFGRRCKSVNFLKSIHTCELMQDHLDMRNPTMLKYYVEPKSDAAWIMPLSCTEQGQQPSIVVPDSIPVQGNPIQAGSCGQTFVEPRIATSLSDRSKHRIVGGSEARPHSLPYIVSLRQGWSMKMHFCGGTLIRVDNGNETDIVITAAHCLYNEPANMQVVAGAHNLRSSTADEQAVEASRYVLHPDYDGETMVNDIAIIKLDKPIRFGRTAQPACLPLAGEQVADQTPGLVAGWGLMEEGQRQAINLMQVVVPTVNSQKCITSYKNAEEPMDIVPKVMLCAGYPIGGKDACQGDSGGPLTYKTKNGFILQGVVSFGEGCAREDRPGIYARVSNYIDWINETVESLKKS
jgi:transmembrane serine protease 3